MAILAFVNSNILERVFSVVALARRIMEVLRPYQILISLEGKKKWRLAPSLRNSSGLEKELEVVAEKTARFNK
jgi:hypothetical protein